MLADSIWGTVPEWLAAVGTVGTLVIGLALLRKQLGSLSRDAEQAKRAQANSVSAWTSSARAPAAGQTLVVRNGSSQPVYRLIVFTSDERGQQTVRYMSNPVGPHHEEETFPVTGSLRDVELDFDDADGRTWRRSAAGLVQLTDQGRWAQNSQLLQRTTPPSALPPPPPPEPKEHRSDHA